VSSGALVMHFILPKEKVKITHIGVSVTKRSVLLACRRNRIKRQIRAVIQQQKEKVFQTLPPGFYMVLYKGKIEVSSECLSEDFNGVLKRFIELH
jgi:ribonuclease P protein component